MSFFIIHLIPGDPVAAILGDFYTQESYVAMVNKLGLDRPLVQQYTSFIHGLLTLDLGTSFQNQRPVFQNILVQLPFTVHLAVASLLVAVLIALPAGIISALRRNSAWDLGIMFGALVGVSAPLYVVAIVLIIVFSLYLGWFPSFGVGAAAGLASLLSHLALPAVTQGLRTAALLARVTRASMLDTLELDFVRTARAKGLAERRVILRHVLPNATIPILTVLGINMATLLGGTVIIETVFSRQGVGRVLVGAVLSRDYPQIQATLLVLVFFTVVANTVVDILYSAVDPRIRYS